MKWSDQGICLHVRTFGEQKQIATFLTEQRGVYQGIFTKNKRVVLQPGNEYQVDWSARLADHLGTWKVELFVDHLSHLFLNSELLLGVASACAMCLTFMPERQIHRDIFGSLQVLLNALKSKDWLSHYVIFEHKILQDQGYIMNWSECAVTKSNNNLAYISPQTGNIVSHEGAQGYEQRLIPLQGSYPVSLKRKLYIYQELFERLHFKNEATPPLPKARANFLSHLSISEC